jgi:sugar-specific transcriptional regulator TrmB
MLTMKETLAEELTQLGLTPTEAQIYLALVQNGAMGASAVAAATGLARTAVYPTLGALVDKGLVDAGEGYGSRFSPVPAEQVLPHLMAADKAALDHREQLTTKVIERISSLEEQPDAAPDELIQVIRSPRAVAERFDRLQLEAERSIDAFVKGPPVFGDPSNPIQEKAQRRGVHYRGLYEGGLLQESAMKARVLNWMENGEESRVFPGELPQKLVIFDSKIVLMPLVRPGETTKTVIIRHPELAQTLALAFQYLWDRAEPLTHQRPGKAKTKGVPLSKPPSQRNDKPALKWKEPL